MDEEIAQLQAEPPTRASSTRFQNQHRGRRSSTASSASGGFGGKADQLNAYYFRTGNPDYFEEDLARYRALAPATCRPRPSASSARGACVVSVVPEGRRTSPWPEVMR